MTFETPNTAKRLATLAVKSVLGVALVFKILQNNKVVRNVTIDIALFICNLKRSTTRISSRNNTYDLKITLQRAIVVLVEL